MFRTLLAFFAFVFIRIYCRFLRYIYVDRHHSILALENRQQILYAFYHGKQFMLLGYPVEKPMVQMVSLSRDGDLQAEILRNFGFTIVRGSPGKNGRAALFEMIELVLAGCNAALAIDGSRGPYGKVKPGILHVARDSSGVIIPLVAAAKRKIVLKSTWDKYEIPLPFTRTVVLEGQPIEIDEAIDDFDLEKKRVELEEILVKLHLRAEKIAQGKDELEDEDETEKHD